MNDCPVFLAKYLPTIVLIIEYLKWKQSFRYVNKKTMLLLKPQKYKKLLIG